MAILFDFIKIILICLTLWASLVKNTPNEQSECTSRACITAAKFLKDNIDESIDPCEDFNKFSCNGFFKNSVIPDDETYVNILVILRNRLTHALSALLIEPIGKNDINSTENAKKYYRACLNESNIEINGERQMLDIINEELGGWPLIGTSTIDDPLEKLISITRLGLKPFFDLYANPDPKSPDNTILRLQQPSWYMTKSSYSNEKLYTLYKATIKKIVQLFKRNMTVDEEDINNMFDLEKQLADATLSKYERRRQYTYENYTIGKLSDDFPGLNWTHLIINGAFRNLNVSLTPDEPILVTDSLYFKKLGRIYKKFASSDRKKDLLNLITWYLFKSKMESLPKKYISVQLEFEREYRGLASNPPRDRICSYLVQKIMPFAVGRLYVGRHFDEKSKSHIGEIIENIRSEFKTMMSENNWMDNESKKAALEKADFLDVKVAYPDFTFNDTYLNTLYKRHIFDENNYLANSLRVTRNDFERDLKNLRFKRQRKNWISGPAVANAFYSQNNNQICIPAGILQAPFFDSNAPNYLNYGAIGMVVGHELTHGFDDIGRRYDKNGIFFRDDEVGLWTNKTIENYLEKVKCIIDQYSKYKSEQVNQNVNENQHVRGFQTQGENIADNGGIKEAYRAYKNWERKNGREPLLPGMNYTQDQLFFINYAQVWCSKIQNRELINRIENGNHSPSEFRIIGPTSNLDEFAKAFNCRAGQNNNPVLKCSIW